MMNETAPAPDPLATPVPPPAEERLQGFNPSKGEEEPAVPPADPSASEQPPPPAAEPEPEPEPEPAKRKQERTYLIWTPVFGDDAGGGKPIAWKPNFHVKGYNRDGALRTAYRVWLEQPESNVEPGDEVTFGITTLGGWSVVPVRGKMRDDYAIEIG